MFFEWETFHTTVVEKIKAYITVIFFFFFFENLAVEKYVQPNRPVMKI